MPQYELFDTLNNLSIAVLSPNRTLSPFRFDPSRVFGFSAGRVSPDIAAQSHGIARQAHTRYCLEKVALESVFPDHRLQELVTVIRGSEHSGFDEFGQFHCGMHDTLRISSIPPKER